MDEDDDQNVTYLMLFAATAVLGSIAARKVKKAKPRSTELSGKRFVVTGANSGIGYATAKELHRRGADVVAAVRDLSTIRDIDLFEKVVHLDLVNLASIKKAVRDIPKPVTCLINNAGSMHASNETINGVEKTTMTNFLGPLYLTEKLMAANDSNLRIVNVGSKLANKSDLEKEINSLRDLRGLRGEGYNMWMAYSNSKYLSMLASQHMSNQGADVFTVTPGVCNTRLNRWVNPVILAISWPLRATFLNSPEKGASAVVYAAASENARVKSDTSHIVYDSNKPFKTTCGESSFGMWSVERSLDAKMSSKVYKMAHDLLTVIDEDECE